MFDMKFEMNRFAVIDVETANADVASICQIGVVVYERGVLVESWSSLVNPRAVLDLGNIAVHSIVPAMVQDAPTFEDIKPTLMRLFSDAVVCSYSNFDRRALAGNDFELFASYPWLDVMRVARGVWAEFGRRGYGLANVTHTLGIEMEQHHDALSDAQAAAEVLLRAMATEQFWQRDWLEPPLDPASLVASRSKKPFFKYPSINFKDQTINQNGDYFGSVCVFTGGLPVGRDEAMRLANAVGFLVGSSVTRQTTHLIIGEQDLSRLNGHRKSSKERRALELTQKGQRIVFLSGQDFLELIQVN